VAPIVACWLFKTSAKVDLLTLKVLSKSHVTWATSVPILVFSVLELGPTDVRQLHHLMLPPYGVET